MNLIKLVVAFWQYRLQDLRVSETVRISTHTLQYLPQIMPGAMRAS
jgi:hypothetical protein